MWRLNSGDVAAGAIIVTGLFKTVDLVTAGHPYWAAAILVVSSLTGLILMTSLKVGK